MATRNDITGDLIQTRAGNKAKFDEGYDRIFGKKTKTVVVEEEEQDLNKCPSCGGVADNGHDRCVPPAPYYCTRCQNR